MSTTIYPSGTRIAGRYEVAGRPLLGGMGIVYLCYDHQEQRPVALKTFKPQFLADREARTLFLKEGDTWVRLGKHPHIVQAYSVERIGDGREVYLVLECIAKEQGRQDASLRSWIAPGRPLPAEQALLIALQIVRGMAHATVTIPGFVHRDLKPENVLIGADRLTDASTNRVRVTDFGLGISLRAVHAAGEPLVEVIQGRAQPVRGAAILGTPLYMAPEQWEGATVDTGADIYALGCILGEMLTGRPLLRGETLEELRKAHRAGKALASVRNLVRPTLLESLKGCLAEDPRSRYSEWVSVEVDLEAVYSHLSGRSAPKIESLSEFSKAERLAIGWSYHEIGAGYVELGQPKVALGYFKRAIEAGQYERDRGLTGAGLTGTGLAHASTGDALQAVECHLQALDISREIGDRMGECAALGNLGGAYRELGHARQAILTLEQQLVIAREVGDCVNECNALCGLGVAYANQGEVRRAFSYYEQALALNRMTDDRRSEGITLGNLGNAYRQVGDARQAIALYEQALAIGREIGDPGIEGTNLGNLGNAWRELGDERRAIGYFEKALAIHREIGDRRGEGTDLGNLGSSHGQLGDAQRAFSFFEQALAIGQEIGDVSSIATDSFNMALLHARQRRWDSALPLIREAVRSFTLIGDTSRARQAQQLMERLERQGRWP